MVEIAVIGGGFVGQAFAIAAARRGYRVDLYDRKPRPVMPAELSSNVIAVNPSSSDFLEQLGAWQCLPETFRMPYRRMEVLDGTGTGAVTFSAAEAGLPQLGHIVDQAALLAALAAAADSQKNLCMNWASDLADDLPEAELLVAADGAHSMTREKLGIRKISYRYQQTATVCMARFDLPHEGVARQWFHEQGPVALLPLSEPTTVAVVWSSSESLQDLDDGAFRLRLEEAIEGAAGDVLQTGPRFSFPLIQQHALQYVQPGVALLGDAAHTIHPLAGQGANLGFADARRLATEIASARLEGRSPGDLLLLKRFERARKPENHLVALAMEGFHRLFTNRQPVIELARNSGLRLFDENMSLKRLAISVATGRV